MVQRLSVLVIAVLLLTTGAAAAETDAKIAPILKIDGVQAKQSIFQAARRKEPLVIRTAEGV